MTENTLEGKKCRSFTIHLTYLTDDETVTTEELYYSKIDEFCQKLSDEHNWLECALIEED